MSAVRLVRAWPIELPERLAGGYAARVERERTARGDYPPEWPAVAWLVKTIAGWRCERCRTPHGPVPHMLTVHHLDGDKANLEHWNLAALCQRCHLQIQGRVVFSQDWPFAHTAWMAVHVAGHNEWARRQPCPACTGRQPSDEAGCGACGGSGHRPLLSLRGVVERDPASYWPEVSASGRVPSHTRSTP